jgi:hypothetical protein
MNIALSLVTTTICLVFASIVGSQYVSRTRPHQLVWSIALLIFGLGAFCQFLAEDAGWTPSLYRMWYYTGAMLAAAFLGQGTVYLMAPRRFAHVTLVILIALSSAGLALVAVLPVDLSRAVTASGVTGNGLPGLLLLLLIPLNTYGTVALVGGGLWSVVRARRDHSSWRRAAGTLLIAVGGLIVALGGTANRLGVPGLLYLTEMLGVGLIFGGYLQTMAASQRSSAKESPIPAVADSQRTSSVST